MMTMLHVTVVSAAGTTMSCLSRQREECCDPSGWDIISTLGYKTHSRKHLLLSNSHFHPSIVSSL
ncbi:hypothetical protein PAXRUDRAFT_833411 [Paxillus rubicundulus Ve08.2h10]|uniref:Uncharacterized protein n=1 Tax=Paxillus rubicundulus Ve08.2h10 TaxID=930991 RepID=A0A0D0CYC8_9AGAM|nr:hypothetical protein PAXRUDRAFT_833411 [Paxillus rubicundulus Ve08.2h10]